MCDSRCWYARSSPSACRCDCHGANHGRGSGYHQRSRVRFSRNRYPFRVIPKSGAQFFPKIQPIKQKISFKDYLKTIGKSALTTALIQGLSVAIPPPFGAIAIPAYMAYNYSKLSYDLYEAYRKSATEGNQMVTKQTFGKIGESLSKSYANTISSDIVSRVGQSGLLKNMAEKTGVKEVVFSAMIKGSISSALTTSGGELAKFVIGRAVGT